MSKIIKPLPLIIVYTIIIYFSLRIPPQNIISISNMDKLGHLIAYLVLSLTIFISISGKKYRIIFLFISFAMGIMLEIFQGMLGYREMSLADSIANSLGLLFGALTYKFLKKQIIFILKKLRLNTIYLNGK